jgi:long-subunit fatty acid transport protein
MKKIAFFFLFSFSLISIAQQKKDFWDHVRFGGGFSLAFGNQTTIGVSPSAIYDFDNGFSVGTGVNYIYREIGAFTTNVYGASLISLYQIPKVGIQLSSELEYYFAKQKDSFGSATTNFPALHLGASYNKGRFAFGLRYDILYNEEKSVFASPISPIVRFYF